MLPVILLYVCFGVYELLRNRPEKSAVLVALIAAVLVMITPSSVQFTQRAYAGVESVLAPYRRDRTWLVADDANENILRNTRFIIETLREVSSRVNEQECIYAFQAPLVMLYTLRVTGILPPPETADMQFLGSTVLCRYYLALPLADTAGHYPEYYPMQRLRPSEHQLTEFYQDSQARTGTAIYLLRRIKDTITVE